MTSVLDQVNETRGHLLGMHRAEYDRLGSALSQGATSLTLEFSAATVGPGSFLAINDELVYVWSVSNTTVTVQRGMFGSGDFDHDQGDLVEINPRFPQFAIKQQLLHEYRSWAPTLFTVETVELSCDSGRGDIDLSAEVDPDYLSVLRVTKDPATGRYDEVGVGFREERGRQKIYLDTLSGSAVSLTADIAYPIARGDVFESATDIADLGVAQGMEDIAPLGAVWRLVAGREVRRNLTDSQGEPRDAQEVPSGAITQTARAMKALRDERIREEAGVLRHRYPFRKHL